jgi:hypothetical protein
MVLDEYKNRYDRERSRLQDAFVKAANCAQVVSDGLAECLAIERQLFGYRFPPPPAIIYLDMCVCIYVCYIYIYIYNVCVCVCVCVCACVCVCVCVCVLRKSARIAFAANSITKLGGN